MTKSAPQFHRELIVWQRAMDLLVECYRLARSMPVEERFGMASQLRRAALAVPLNIAEGNGRRTRGEYLAALSVAHGELMEVQTLFDAADRVGYVAPSELAAPRATAAHVGRLLHGLVRSLRREVDPSEPRLRHPVPGPRSPAGPPSPPTPVPSPPPPPRSAPHDPARSR